MKNLKDETRGYIASREIYVNYPRENIKEFMDKFLTDKTRTVVGLINTDRDIIEKTRGFEIGTVLVITSDDIFSLREKLSYTIDILSKKEMDFRFIKNQYKIIINEN